MKQSLILSSVICLFLLVWGTVIYQIFVQEESIMFARDLPYIQIEHAEREFVLDDRVESDTGKRDSETENIIVEETGRKYTELNKRTAPPLHEGLDFGDGISIDDLLRGYGIAVNNS